MIERATLHAHDAFVSTDNAWQRRVRLHQALWREAQGLPAGEHNGRLLGSRLAPGVAEPPGLANYLTPQARRQVQHAVDSSARTGALLSRPRIWVDLLSSQPLCFNLFGPLAEDHDLATRILKMLWPDVHRVTDIRFEWSPGRGDDRYTGNRSAFDVFVEYESDVGRSFLGIEVKYHEDLTGTPARDESGRYPRIAAEHGVFRQGSLDDLARLPLQQLWLDHLLALQMLAKDDWQSGRFVLLYPMGNIACSAAAARYRTCLNDTTTFDARTLDDVVQAARLAAPGSWPEQVYGRYLDPALVAASPDADDDRRPNSSSVTSPVRFEVRSPVPCRVVEGLSSVRLAFEPKGAMRDYRRELAEACRTLHAQPGEILHAVYASKDDGVVDLENVLTYNLGTGDLRPAARSGLVLELAEVETEGWPHCHRYAAVASDAPWSHWREGELIATLELDASPDLFTNPKAGRWWLAARRGDLRTHSLSTAGPLAVRVTVSPPVGWRGSLVSLLKPMVDGLISALHVHTGSLDAVAERCATVDPALHLSEFERLLTAGESPLGAVRLLILWGDTLQWHPADDRIAVLDVRLAPTGPQHRVAAQISAAVPGPNQSATS